MARVNRGKCPVCFTGKFQSGHEDVAELWGDSPVVIKNLPVMSCEQCGHRLISATVAKSLEKMLDMTIHENKVDALNTIPLHFPIEPLVAGTASISLHTLTFEQTIRVLAHTSASSP